MGVLFAISCLLFGTWFALSVVKQFRPIPPRVFWLENFTVVPRWWFFRYNFREGDFRISIRHVGADDGGSEWEVVALPKAPLWRQWIWNPELRTNKELWDACVRLCALPQWLRFSKNFSPSTVAFGVLTTWVAATPNVGRGPGGAIRVMVERVPLTGDPVAWFVSRPFVPSPPARANASAAHAVPVG